MTRLVVELYGERVGWLQGDDRRSVDFELDVAALDRFTLNSTVLSCAVPLALKRNRARAAHRRAFFEGLLPEGDVLEALARELRVQPFDTMALLESFGRDVAGAVQIWNPDRPDEPRTPALAPVTDEQIAAMLRDVFVSPLANTPGRGGTSLAGIQGKLVLARTGGAWHRVLDGAPSTHIVKPASQSAPTMIFDEEFGARLARTVGLIDYDVEIRRFDGVPALVVERYDRAPDAPQGRIHQEDLAQALGASPREKYQRHGTLTMARMAQVLSRVAGAEGVRELLRVTTLAVALGNLDLHAKNISMLHLLDESARIAPAYDMVPMAHQTGVDGQLAFAVNGQYRHAAVTLDDLVMEAASWGVRDARPVTVDTLESIRDAAKGLDPVEGSHPRLADDVVRFSSNLLDGRGAGEH